MTECIKEKEIINVIITPGISLHTTIAHLVRNPTCKDCLKAIRTGIEKAEKELVETPASIKDRIRELCGLAGIPYNKY